MPVTLDFSFDDLITPYAKTLLAKHYFASGETSPQEAYARAAEAYSGGDDALAQRIYEYAAKQWMMFASPVLSNAPKRGEPWKALPASCFLSWVGDTRESIVDARSEVAWLTFMGGGVGSHVSSIRAAGAKSNGPIPFLKVMDTQMLSDRQANIRRGSIAFYMDVSHVDVMEFIASKDPAGNTGEVDRKLLNSFPAINLTDKFMAALKNDSDWDFICPHTREVKGTIKAREVWRRIMDYRRRTGVPYLCFIDTANKKMPQEYKDKGLNINGSNLCVAPETPILTKEYGYAPIGELVGKYVDVWNGLNWSQVQVAHTAQNAELVRVTFSDGSSIDCTPEHKFYTQNQYNGAPKETRAKDLVTGDKLEKFDLPTDFDHGTKLWDDAYAFGFYCGDGNKGYDISWIYEEKQKVIPRLQKGGVSDAADSHGRFRWNHGGWAHKDFEVPFQLGLKTKLEFLAGYLDADGCVVESNNCQNIQVCSVNRQFLHDIKLMLQTMGVPSSLTLRREAGTFLLPKNDGSDENGEYECQEVWLLNLNGTAIARLVELGLDCARLTISPEQKPQRDASRFVTVSSVERTGRRDDTYCFTEEQRHRGMFNGILTGQCSEIFIPTSDDRTAVCVLSSVNLEKWDEWKDHPTFVQDLVTLLDNVVEKFIENCPPQLHKAKLGALRGRDIGLGAMGLHALFQAKGIPFGSLAAKMLNKQIFKTIRERADEQNYKLSIERGAAPDAVDKRCVQLMAIAPNSNNSVILGTSASIEPWADNAFIRDTRVGQELVKNKHLEQLLETKGKNTQEVWKSIIGNEGSVTHLDFLTDDEREVFKTAFEIDQRWIIELAADRQEYIDQGQSLNLFFDSNASNKAMSDTHILAWEKGLKSLYYLRSKAASRPNITQAVERVALGSAKPGDEGCLSCHG